MKKIVRLQGLDCANCGTKIERAFQKVPGVTAVSVNFMTAKLVLEYDETQQDQILENMDKIIHKIDRNIVIKKG